MHSCVCYIDKTQFFVNETYQSSECCSAQVQADIKKKKIPEVKTLSVTNNSVSSRIAATSHVSHNSSAHVALSGSSQTDIVVRNWKGLDIISAYVYGFWFLQSVL